MALTMQIDAQAFPVVEQNTFLTVCCTESEMAPRRCSSVPARWRSREAASELVVPQKQKWSDMCDSEAITDFCTDASEERSTCSDSASTTEDCESLDPSLPIKFGEVDDEPPPPPPPPIARTPLRTALSSKAACWKPAAPAKVFEPAMWRVGAPKDRETLTTWQDSIADFVAQMSLAVEKVACVLRVDCRREGHAWEVTAHVNAEGFYQFQSIQTVAKESLLKSLADSECLHLMGKDRTPFQPTPNGFCTSLGSMRNTKKACWNYYNTGVCPRASKCIWEHPAVLNTVNVIIDMSECCTGFVCVPVSEPSA